LDSEGKGDTVSQLDDQIEKAMINHDDDVVAVMKEVRKTLAKIGGD
jgi:hypothetical protein